MMNNNKSETTTFFQTMTVNEWRKQYCGLNGLLRRNVTNILTYFGKVKFTPAHKVFDFKLSHTFLIGINYKKGSTILFIIDTGFFSLVDPKSKGRIYTFNKRIKFKEFLGEEYSYIFNEMYEECEKELRSKAYAS